MADYCVFCGWMYMHHDMAIPARIEHEFIVSPHSQLFNALITHIDAHSRDRDAQKACLYTYLVYCCLFQYQILTRIFGSIVRAGHKATSSDKLRGPWLQQKRLIPRAFGVSIF